MARKRRLEDKLVVYILSALLIVMASFAIVNVLTSYFSLGEPIINRWDGVSVSSSFSSGNGTKENPYIINNGADLAYFKSLVEGLNSIAYNSAYYKLGSDIDLGDHEFKAIGISEGEDKRLFKGNFDGNGYTIKNAKILGNIIDTYEVYGLFTILDGGTVSNINLENMDIFPSQTANPLMIGVVAGSVETKGSIKNVSIYNSGIDLTATNENTNSKIGTVVGKVATDVNASNIYVNVNLSSKYRSGVAKVSHTIESDLSNIVVNINVDSLMAEGVSYFATSNNQSTIKDLYITNVNNGELVIKKGDSNISNDKLITELDKGISDEFYWSVEAGVLKLVRVKKQAKLLVPKAFAFGKEVLVEHESGVVGNTVYVNDLDSDYNYYMGKNYTTSDGTLPTQENKNIYNSSNLVKVFMAYHGEDINNASLVGHVSLSEQQSKYVYYKYYVVENGYVDIELIDNPFTDRPNDKAFNGWITDYPGATIIYDYDYYVRHVRIPVTYTNGVPNDIQISMYASWTKATVSQITGNSWSFGELNDAGMKEFGGSIPIYEDTSQYYLEGSISRNEDYPDGAVDSSGRALNGTCNAWWFGSCTYYVHSPSDYDPTLEYYKLENGRMNRYYPQQIGEEELEGLPDGGIASGFYRSVHLSRNQSLAGYYDDQGGYQTGGTCTSNNGCNYFELIQFYDNNGNINLVDNKTNDYYYLVTRDTNIVVLRSNINSNFSQSKPFTLTSVHNGVDYRNSASFNIQGLSISIGADTTIENVRISTTSNPTNTETTPPSSGGSRNIFGRWYNLKIGRGITKNDDNINFNAIVGGTTGSTGSSSNPTKYTLIVESGLVNSMALSTGTSGGTDYLNARGIYGSDYDRVTGNNSNLEVRHCASGSWGGTIRGRNNTDIALNLTVKSGGFGTNHYDYATGIYVGGRNGGTHYSPRAITVEGGYIYNLIGGPLTSSNQANYNDTYMYIKGGSVDLVIGGAGRSETYGNRIIQVTDGTINYSVFGGSNGVEGNDSSSYRGTLDGTPYVYIGGHAIIGNSNYIGTEETESKVEAGSVFGIGNGRNGYDGIGSCDNSNVIIDGNALVRNNVYGGGNYGATGYSSSANTNNTSIKVKGGTINGSVYGGGNNNGAGTSSKISTINIDMTGGTVNGSVYGGSRTSGTVYGSTNVNILGGVVTTDVYGGGEGNGTYVARDVAVKIGDNAYASEPNIKRSVYGGSAFGTVNNTTRNTNVSSYKTDVVVNKGVIAGSVFGGGMGSSTYTPYVAGNVTVTTNNGNIGNVFGGNDAAGSPNGSVIVYLNGGTIGNAFGGGNNTGQTTTNIYLQGATVTSLFGGSNLNGVVTTANVTMTAGTATNIYGGNNKGTATTSANVNISGGNVKGDIYGGGMEAPVTRGSNVNITNAAVNNVYGGGQKADVADAIVKIKDTTGSKVFGGSNTEGTVGKSTITIDGQVAGTGDLISTNVVRTGGWGNGNTTSVVYRVTLTNHTATAYSDWKVKLKLLSEYSAASYNISNHPYQNSTDGVIVSNITDWNNTLAAYGTYSFDITVNYNYVYDYNNPVSFDIFAVESETISPSAASTSFDSVYGGNNAGGTTEDATVTINNGKITSVYGGGNLATTGAARVLVNGGVIGNVFGGGNEAGLTMSDVDILGGTVTNVFGGSNNAGIVGTTDIVVGDEPNQVVTGVPTITNITGTATRTTVQYSVTLRNISSTRYDEWELKLNAPYDVNSVTSATYDVQFTNGVAYVGNVNKQGSRVPLGGNSSLTFNFQVVYNERYEQGNQNKYMIDLEVVNPSPVAANSPIQVSNIYGGNNLGGSTGPTKIIVNSGTINDIYGGGNKAIAGTTNVVVRFANVKNIFGGGKAATVEGNTFLDIDNCTLNTNVFGGGDEGMVTGNTEVFVTNSAIKGSLYAGGNGSTAVVHGNTNVTMDGASVVGTETSKTPYEGCVFGGGNSAVTGTEEAGNSFAVVNIVGGHIYGNVYGGANTSIVYGGTVTNIGSNVVEDKSLKQTDIIIEGTVFGGGEANASGDDDYDFDFFSVVGSINIYIDGTGYLSNGDRFDLSGSIFGSGNASSSSGTSNILIKKLGTQANPSKNLSIQRTNNLTIDNSYMELIGIEDSTNDFASIKYSFNRIDKLVIKNNTTLLLRKNANLLKEFYSGVDVNGNLVPAVVEVNDEEKKVTKNVDNRVYMIPYNNLNITTTQDATSYGRVTGMTFFGMYNASSDGSLSYGLYDYDVDYGDATGAQDMIIGSSYVLGLHHANHDIKVDGFYTNVFNEEMTEIITEYIEPSPPDSNFYRWMIGMQTINYTVDLTASKYSSLGTYSLTMLDFPDGDTKFEVMGFNSSGLNAGINLIDPSEIPRIADTEEIANSTFGLAMKSETREWTNYGVTEFTGEDGGRFSGETHYKTDSQKVAPSLMFYLYHPKNISKEGDVGSVLITLQSEEKLNEIESTFNYVTITVNIVARNYEDGNSYDASITYDKKYEMPSATAVNVTNRSQFTAYYSLYASGALKDIYGTDYNNYHVLTSTYAFPIGTQITMIDYGYDINNPQYYYFDVTNAVYQDSLRQLENEGEIAYRLSDFIKMGSTSATNTYNDNKANREYYDGKSMAMEEFVFIFDLKETKMTGQQLEKSILFELRNASDTEVITVLGIRRQLMQFSLYDNSNVVLQEEMTSESEYLYYNIDNQLDFQSIVGYDQTSNGAAIIDTNYESSAMGLNMYVYDSSGNQVSSSLLTGTVLSIDGTSVFADSDGVFRAKLAGKVSNLSKSMNLLIDKMLPPGQYKLRFILFASADGKHNSSLEKSDIVDIDVTVVGDDNAIKVTTDDRTKVVDGDTGLNELKTKTNEYVLTYRSVLVKPNIRVSLYKRDTTDKDTTVYNEIDFNTLFTNNLNSSSYGSNYLYEKELKAVVNSDNTFKFELQDELTSGTYKLVFRLYDGSQLIEEENEYIIVTKDIVK